MKEELKQLQKQALEKVSESNDQISLQKIEVQYLGRKGELTAILHKLKDLSPEEKRVMGPLTNEVKESIIAAIEVRRNEVEAREIEKKLSHEFFDITAPAAARTIGHIHPISQIQYEVENIFHGMGFAVADGPEVESEYYNFEGLNIPADHPARDMQDTFFVSDKHEEKHGRLVLRTHTSPVQIRTMEKYGAPLRIIIPGRVFRYEATDASHDTTFYQVEGLMIDKNVSLASLKGVMEEFLSRLFAEGERTARARRRVEDGSRGPQAERAELKNQIKVRFRPGYFPFVEPGIELDFSCLICGGKGCSVCKQTGWVEFMGAGMVHPNVLKAGGIDPDKNQGWAFGFGLTRLVMMRYGIDDIRLLTSGDLRFTQQF